MRKFVLFLFGFCVSNIFADDSIHELDPSIQQINVPDHCQVLGYQYSKNNLSLINTISAHNKRLYFLYNNSNKPVLLDHITHPGRGAGAGWSSMLQPSRWSALLLSTNKDFTFTCKVKAQNSFKIANCSNIIKAFECSYPNIESKSNTSSWLVENKSHAEFVDYLNNHDLESAP